MQFIHETEPDIKKDMANLNESLNEKFIANSIRMERKTDMFEINKGNILRQDNLFDGAGTASGYNKTADESVKEEVITDLKNKEVSNPDAEITLNETIDTNMTRTEDNVVENGFNINEEQERQERRELHCIIVCMKYEDNFSENKENPKTGCKEKVIEKAVATANTKGYEQVISVMEEKVYSEVYDHSVKYVINNEEENIANGTESKECTEMEIPETSETSKSTYDDKSVPNDKCTKSNQDTAIPSVDDEQSCFIKEALSDRECKLSSTDNLEKEAMETDDTTTITFPDKSVKTAADKQEHGINIKNLEKNPIKTIDVTKLLSDATKNIAVNVLDTLNLENEDGKITHTPLMMMDESLKTAAVSHDSVMEVDDGGIDLERECIEAGAIIQTPLIDETKEAATDSNEKIVGVGDNINDLENTESGDTSPLTNESNKTTVDLRGNVIDIENIKDIVKETGKNVINTAQTKPVKATSAPEKKIIVIKKSKKRNLSATWKQSDTINILSDDEEDEPPTITENSERQLKVRASEKQCIIIDDDDDVIVIEEDTNNKTQSHNSVSAETQTEILDLELKEKYNNKSDTTMTETVKLIPDNNYEESTSDVTDIIEQSQINETSKNQIETNNGPKSLLSENLLRLIENKLAEMTQDELEEFCIQKIVETVHDRAHLLEIKTKLENMLQSLDEYSSKSSMLTTQNRNLQVVIKTIEAELKKNTDQTATPMKITRSVGLQVFIPNKEKPPKRIVIPVPNPARNASNNQIKIINIGQSLQHHVQVINQNHSISVPRMVPATQNNTTVKAPVSIQVPSVSNQLKTNIARRQTMLNQPKNRLKKDQITCYHL